MIDEKQYWEKYIAFAVFVFALYPFTKDYVDEPILEGFRNTFAQFLTNHMLGGFITRSIAAYFLAMFISAIIFIGGEWYISRLKKKKIDELYKDFD